jgi:hypothetical protein
LRNLNWFRGEVRTIVGPGVAQAVVDGAIDFGVMETFKTLVNQYQGHYRTTRYYDIAENKDKYPFPEDLFKMTALERYDLEDVAVELVEERFGYRDIDVTQRMWCPLSTVEFLIRPEPIAAKANGMRLFYLRKPKPMAVGEDVCDLPDETHYWAVFKAVDHLMLKPGVTIANPEKYESVRQEYAQLMNSIIAPQSEGAKDIVDNDPW